MFDTGIVILAILAVGAAAAAMALVRRRRGGVSDVDGKARLEQTAELERAKARLELDLARHKQIEEALRHSEERYRVLIEHANDVILIAQDGVMKFANPRTESMLGYKGAELANMPFTELIHPDDRALVLDRYMRRLRGEDVPPRYNFRVVSRDGRIFWVEINSVMVDWEGRPATLCFLRDVTDQLRAQEQIRESKQAAEEANRAKSRFLANMSHELRTPMNGIIGLTELALATPPGDEHRRHLEGVLESAEFMLSLINTILDFSKIEADKLSLNPAEFRLRGELSDMMKVVALRAEEKGLRLVCHVRPAVPDYIVGDSSRLRQVLFNLVGNAIKFTHQGEVVLLVEPADRQGRELTLRFSVRDTGIGIPAAKQQLIFEPFQQADDSISRQYGGTGLGLAICRQLVHMMGGELTVDSQQGQGSQFRFTAQFTVPESVPVMALAPPRVRGARALVVDSHRATREAIRDMLLAWQVQACEAKDAEAAMRLVAEQSLAGTPFTLAIIDADAIQGSESSLFDHLKRSSPSTRWIAVRPRLASTDQLAVHDPSMAASASVRKPVMPSELLEAILRCMDTKTASEADRWNVPAAATARPLRILLVEDNLINQRVAINWLQKRGHRVRLATSGEAALDRLAERTYDVVLMDLEMPGLGGTEATARIREREGIRGGHVPIVAMTAHAMEGDRQRCLAAGMDDYLAKPIHPAELFTVVEQFGPPAAREQETPGPGHPAWERATARSTEGFAEPGEMMAFDRQRAIGTAGNDPRLLGELITIFLDDCPKWLRDLDGAVRDHRGEDARRIAHSIKNSAGYFGAGEVHQAALGLEEAARDDQFDRAINLLGTLTTELDRLTPQLARFREEVLQSQA
jgi:PAS domain S-box-containing protein